MNFIEVTAFAALASIFCANIAFAQDPDADTGPPEFAEPLDDYELMMIEFQRYKELLSADSLDEAENSAKRIIEMAIRETGPTSNDTGKALINLAVVQHKTKEFEAAEQNFSAAIDIFEDNENMLSDMLINPLLGLGAAQVGSGKLGLASRTLERAVHISHVNEGPHNLDQIDILEMLAETNLRMGETEDAKNNQDMIYALSVRHFQNNSQKMIPALFRRADWQNRTGYILDERATYRRIIRIIETTAGKNDITLIQPLLKIGHSYFSVDKSQSTTYQSVTASTGEIYLKRAVRIAEENPDSDWVLLSKAKLAIGDYYIFRAEQSRARRAYVDAWDILSAEEDRLAERQAALEQITPITSFPIPQFVGKATRADRQMQNSSLREGQIIATYGVSSRGRVIELEIVEITPADYDDLHRLVQRRIRSQVFRPRYEDGLAVDTHNLPFLHNFYYLQEDLDELREEEAEKAEAKANTR